MTTQIPQLSGSTHRLGDSTGFRPSHLGDSTGLKTPSSRIPRTSGLQPPTPSLLQPPKTPSLLQQPQTPWSADASRKNLGASHGHLAASHGNPLAASNGKLDVSRGTPRRFKLPSKIPTYTPPRHTTSHQVKPDIITTFESPESPMKSPSRSRDDPLAHTLNQVYQVTTSA